MADAVLFIDCHTRHRYPIVMEGDFVALERAYRDAASAPGARLFVTFEGAIMPRPKMEGDGLTPSIVIARFVHAWPQMTCERAKADASLTNTYWKIIRLGDAQVPATPGQREPHLILRNGDAPSRFVATVGCNQLTGTYGVDGGGLKVTPAAATHIACPPPLDALEKELIDALAKATRWQIKANTLEIYDATNTPLALFEAVHF